MPDDDLDPWDLRDPARFLRAVSRRHSLADGDVLLVRVEAASTRQRIASLTELSGDPPERSAFDAEEVLGPALDRLGYVRWAFDPRERPDTLVTVVARRGRVVINAEDLAWTSALRYACNGVRVLLGDVLLVTEHGWRTVPDDLAGVSPRLARRPARRAG